MWKTMYHTITDFRTVRLILVHSYLVGKLTSSKIAETKALEPSLELPAIKIFAKRVMAPATEKFYGEAGVLHGNGLWRAEIF
jgi:hypothetical protein